jgi:hypothetical protein
MDREVHTRLSQPLIPQHGHAFLLKPQRRNTPVVKRRIKTNEKKKIYKEKKNHTNNNAANEQIN